MIDDLLSLLKSDQDLSSHIQSLSDQVEGLERENETRMERYKRLKSKIDRLNAVKSLLVYIEDPLSGEFPSSYSKDFLEKMIKSSHG